MTHLFIDTNIFLHFTFFDEIPWKELTSDDFILVIAPVVLQELDKHKRNPNGKVASRAKNVLAKIEAITDARVSYPLRCIFDRPQNQILEAYHLDRQEQDDLLLAAILEFQHSYPDGTTMLITYDTGPLLKARFLGINARKIDEKFLLPAEKSAEQKEIDKLNKELTAYKNATPKLKLTFERDKQVLTAELDPIQETEEDFIERLYKQDTAHIEPLVYEGPDELLKRRAREQNTDPNKMTVRDMIDAGIPLLLPLRQNQIEEYNKDLNDYLDRYRTYLERSYLFKKIHSLSLPIKLVLHNNGKAPAHEIDVSLHFPDGFKLFMEDELPIEPRKPTPPHRPTSAFDYRSTIPNLSNLHHLTGQPAQTSLPLDSYPGRPNIREANSYEVDNISFKLLKHHHQQLLEPMVVIFQHRDKVINFTIDYKITAANLFEPIVGQLHVIVQAK